VIVAYVELSGESPDLGREEAIAAVQALGGRALDPELGPLVGVELPDVPAVEALAGRLGLARRCLRRIGSEESFESSVATEGASGESAVFRRLGRSPGGSDASVRAAGRAYQNAGGPIDLEEPARRYWISEGASGGQLLLREIATVDRGDAARRRMPTLPFQRPVSLPPRLARAAANLAGIRPEDRVIDPFLGTGALLAEAALLGGRVYGIDRDPEMIRGALRNFAHLGVTATRLVEGDAGAVDLDGSEGKFDALLTDPPYGRSSSTGGEDPADVVARVLPRWGDRVREGGRLVVIAPSGAPLLPGPWVARVRVPVRVHRSLTREFRAYERRG
jgi:tRNA (guanine10-N2)-dimethyltransferase